jgi:hypothetical protein
MLLTAKPALCGIFGAAAQAIGGQSRIMRELGAVAKAVDGRTRKIRESEAVDKVLMAKAALCRNLRL